MTHLLLALTMTSGLGFNVDFTPMTGAFEGASPYVVKRAADRVFAAVQTESTGTAELLVYDLSKNFLGSREIGEGKPEDMVITGDWGYVLVGDALRVLRVKDPSGMWSKQVATATSFLVEGDRMYTTTGGRGVAVYDISVPHTPVLLSSMVMPPGSSGELHHLAKSGNSLYAACGYVPVCHFDLSTTPPTFTPHSYTPQATDVFTTIALRGNYIYVGHKETSISVYDITGDVAPPSFFSLQTAPSGLRPRFMMVVHDTLYVSAYTGGLADPHPRFQIYSLSIPSIPVLQQEYLGPYPMTLHGFSVYEGKAYVAAGVQGILWLGNVENTAPAVTSWGCYKDSLAMRVFDLRYSGVRMTADFCMGTCEGEGYTMAGLQYGDECWCGVEANLVGVEKLPVGLCDMPCAGDAGDLCGAGFAMEVVSRVAQPTRPDPVYVGCYKDQNPRLFPELAYRGDLNSVDKCTALCYDNGYTHAGMEYGRECFCSGSLTGTVVDETQCNKPCPGNPSQTCGGGWRLSVWSL